MRASVVDGEHLDVLMPAPAVDLVFDAQVREVHVVVEVRQVVLERPLFNLPSVAVRVSVVVVPVAIPLMEPLLVLALELVVQDDPVDAGITLRQPLRLALVRAVDLRLMFELALFLEARVERLRRLLAAIPVRLQDITAAVGQDDGDLTAAIEANRIDQALLAEMPQIALPWIGGPVVVVAKIARRHHPERPNDREGAGLGAAKRVLPLACVVDDLAFASSRQVDVPREHVARILIPWIAAAVRRAFIVPLTRVGV